MFLFSSAVSVILISCSGDQGLEISQNSNYSGYIIVSAIGTDSTGGPGFVSLFKPDGTFVRTFYDMAGSDYASGIAFYPPNELYAMIENSEDLEKFNMDTSVRQVIYGNPANLSSAPLRKIAISSLDKSIYVTETTTNSIEKFELNTDGTYSRVGNPFLNGTIGACDISASWGVAYIPSTNQIAVTSSGGGGISIFSIDGSCVANFNTGGGLGGGLVDVVYHALSNKLIYANSTNDGIYSINLDGTDNTLIFADSAVIDVPRTLATDASGHIYVGNSVRDTVEKLFFSGTGTAIRTSTKPLIGPRALSANTTQIVVIP